VQKYDARCDQIAEFIRSNSETAFPINFDEGYESLDITNTTLAMNILFKHNKHKYEHEIYILLKKIIDNFPSFIFDNTFVTETFIEIIDFYVESEQHHHLYSRKSFEIIDLSERINEYGLDKNAHLDRFLNAFNNIQHRLFLQYTIRELVLKKFRDKIFARETDLNQELFNYSAKIRQCAYLNPLKKTTGKGGYDPERLKILVENTMKHIGFSSIQPGNCISGKLVSQIFKDIAQSSLIIADVSTSSPNVLYEVGICHALGKKVLLICEEGRLKNIKHIKYIDYLRIHELGHTNPEYKQINGISQELLDLLMKFQAY
jgi:hypothetical protein